MNPIDLETAVREIVSSTLARTEKDPTAFPFFFIVGAGISAPSVPIASKIVDHCCELAQRRNLKMPALPDDPMEKYEKTLITLHPNPADRQQYFHDLIQNAPISPANLRLAHLLDSHKLTNLVLTTNFDEMLTRALRLFGAECVVCDHPKTTRRIDPNRADLLQVVHVHGTHWFYDCVNLKGEIKRRAKKDTFDDVSMADLLRLILAQRSPIIIGYSGWADDVIMTGIKTWLKQSSHPHNLYWFCYRATEAEHVWKLTKNHPSVRIVVDENEPLDATRVFEAINLALDLPAPAITRDPLKFFAEQLERNLGAKHDRNDIYLIQQVIARVKRGVELEAAEFAALTAKQKANAELVEKISDAVRRGAYAEAVALAPEVRMQELTEEQRRAAVGALMSLYDACWARDPEGMLAVTEALSSALTEDISDEDSAVIRFVRAWALYANDQYADALAAHDEFLRHYGKDPGRQKSVARVLESRAWVLARLGREVEASAARSELRDRFGNDPKFSSTIELVTLNQMLQSNASAEERLAAVESFSRINEDEYYVHGQALRLQVDLLYELKRYAEAIEVANDYMARRADALPSFETATVLITRAQAQLALDQRQEATGTLDLLEQRCPGEQTAQISDLRAKLV
jgi:tetratricopeptide (TPR) repeat protein